MSQAYGFNSKSVAEKLSRIAKNGGAEHNSRRQTNHVAQPLAGGLRRFFGTPDGDIPAGTQTDPEKGRAFILRLNTQTEIMERGKLGAVEIDSVEVWNMGPEVIDDTSSDTLPVIELVGDSHGVLWVESQLEKVGKADADIQPGSTGTISIWRNGADTGEDVDAKFDWIDGTERISAGKEVKVLFYLDEGAWRIDNAECE